MHLVDVEAGRKSGGPSKARGNHQPPVSNKPGKTLEVVVKEAGLSACGNGFVAPYLDFDVLLEEPMLVAVVGGWLGVG